MRLTELNPRWLTYFREEDGRHGMGVSFDCPKCRTERIAVPFSNPIDGRETCYPNGWARTGETFEALSLAPSMHELPTKTHACGWHGFITEGEIINA